MTARLLFDALDHSSDGELSRADLHAGARRLGWHWPEAPLYAVLDRLTLHRPLSRADFLAVVEQIAGDPLGPFGEVLGRVPGPVAVARPAAPRAPPAGLSQPSQPGAGDDDAAVGLLAELLDEPAAVDCRTLLAGLPRLELAAERAVLLVIDPQHAFTQGTWKRSMGRDGDRQVAPIRLAFERCAQALRALPHETEVMFTRCPFPPDSYEWDRRLAGLIAPRQPYFVKPGNSVLWPPSNGFEQWVQSLPARGKEALVIGGCTLNSCVRVSALDLRRLGCARDLQIIVDVGLAGARAGSFVRSPDYGGRSSVAAAVEQLLAAGVAVARTVALG